MESTAGRNTLRHHNLEEERSDNPRSHLRPEVHGTGTLGGSAALKARSKGANRSSGSGKKVVTEPSNEGIDRVLNQDPGQECRHE